MIDKENGVFFLDSGAFTLKRRAGEYAKTHNNDRWGFYDTDEFWDYCNHYAEFVLKNSKYIDYYANVDAIGNPKVTWRNQQYFEREYGLKPVPVIHCGADLKWFKKYMDAGHDYIGMGGGLIDWQPSWLEEVFTLLCPGPSHMPIVRTHGFAMTAYHSLIKFPWYSVDSATWTKLGAFGNIAVPQQRKGTFVFDIEPHIVSVSEEAPGGDANKFFKVSNKGVASASVLGGLLLEWLSEIGVPLGKGKKDDPNVEWGVTNRHSERKIANLLFFERLRAALPPYPWAYKPSSEGTKRTLGF